jgi:hypothetical protein
MLVVFVEELIGYRSFLWLSAKYLRGWTRAPLPGVLSSNELIAIAISITRGLSLSDATTLLSIFLTFGANCYIGILSYGENKVKVG